MAFVTAARAVTANDPDFLSTGKLAAADLRQAIDALQNAELVSGLVSLNGGSNIVASRQMRVIQAANNVPPRTVTLVQAS